MNEAESESFEFSSARPSGAGAEGARDPSITGHFAEIIRMQMRADDIAGRKSPLTRRWSSDHGVKLARASRVISIFQNSFLPLYPPLSARANSIRGGDFSYFRSLIFSCNCKGRSKCYVSKVDIE